MATRGVFQLQKVKVMYCDCGGSSRGVRDFIREKIVDFAKKAPSVEIVTGLRRGHHPYIEGQYLDGTRKIITVKNLAPRDIMNYAEMLRNSSSGKVCGGVLCHGFC